MVSSDFSIEIDGLGTDVKIKDKFLEGDMPADIGLIGGSHGYITPTVRDHLGIESVNTNVSTGGPISHELYDGTLNATFALALYDQEGISGLTKVDAPQGIVAEDEVGKPILDGMVDVLSRNTGHMVKNTGMEADEAVLVSDVDEAIFPEEIVEWVDSNFSGARFELGSDNQVLPVKYVQVSSNGIYTDEGVEMSDSPLVESTNPLSKMLDQAFRQAGVEEEINEFRRETGRDPIRISGETAAEKRADIDAMQQLAHQRGITAGTQRIKKEDENGSRTKSISGAEYGELGKEAASYQDNYLPDEIANSNPIRVAGIPRREHNFHIAGFSNYDLHLVVDEPMDDFEGVDAEVEELEIEEEDEAYLLKLSSTHELDSHQERVERVNEVAGEIYNELSEEYQFLNQ